MEKLPEYVVRPGEPCHQPPFACDSTQLYGFYVRGQREAIQTRLIDPALNAPRGGQTRYQAFTDYVMVTYSITARGTSIDPPDSQQGYVPEYCWTVWVPLLVVKSELGIHVAERLVMYPAFITVDNPWSLVAGREVYGFPKNQGPLTIPAAGEDPARFAVQSLAFVHYDPKNEARIETLMRVDRQATTTIGEQVWDDLEDAIRGLVGFLHHDGGVPVPGFGLLVDLFNLARHREVPAVFLKQFRDAVDGTRACYQAVIEAGCQVTGFHGGGLLDGNYVLTASELASMPLASALGLDPAGVAAEFPFWANIDFVVEDVKEVWKAGSHG